jgi:NAD(P)-dependent dehydrogenase (short-subunit alcohol dehydrogenase family)
MVADNCRKAGAEVSECLGDLSDPGEAVRLVRHAETAFGDIDGLVTAAGFADVTSVKDLDAGTLMESYAAIDQAFALLVQNALPALKNSSAGRIVAVSSFVAHSFQLDGKHLPASAMAKAGLEALVQAFAVELATDDINVNCVVPGYIDKDKGAERAIDETGFKRAIARIPKSRLGRPDDVAAAIEFLLSEDADYITGQCLHVDGGLTL